MASESKNNVQTTMQLQTKVTPEVYAKLQSLADQYGFSIFQALRMMAETLIRYTDDEHNLSEEMVRAIRMFEDIPGWRKSICLTDHDQQLGITEAIYILRAKGKEGHRIVLVERPAMDGDAEGWTSTYNVQRILERFIEVLNPSLYKHLRQLAVDLGTDSLLDTIHTIANLYKENPDEKELRLQFESNDWHQGAQMHSDTRYQRHNSHSMEYIDQRQQKLFE